jgi:hypothetical protein
MLAGYGHCGVARVGWMFTFAAVYTLVRMRTLAAVG